VGVARWVPNTVPCSGVKWFKPFPKIQTVQKQSNISKFLLIRKAHSCPRKN
jgi:hypothetical protein